MAAKFPIPSILDAFRIVKISFLVRNLGGILLVLYLSMPDNPTRYKPNRENTSPLSHPELPSIRPSKRRKSPPIERPTRIARIRTYSATTVPHYFMSSNFPKFTMTVIETGYSHATSCAYFQAQAIGIIQ